MGVATPEFNVEGSTVLSLIQSGTTDDKFNAFIIWFEGDPDVAATTTVTATYDINFFLDGVADTSVNTTGTIVTDDAAQDTLGEIAALVNASTTGWKMQICAGFTGDTVYSSGSSDVILTPLNNATYDNGDAVGVNWDVSKLEAVRACIGPEAMGWLQGGARRSQIVARGVDANPAQENFAIVWQPNNWQSALGELTALFGDDGSSGTAVLTVYSADQNDTISTATQIAIANSTFADDTAETLGTDSLLAVSKPGQRLVVRFTGTSGADAMDAISFSAIGYCKPTASMSIGSAS